jgi:hypothetical protein
LASKGEAELSELSKVSEAEQGLSWLQKTEIIEEAKHLNQGTVSLYLF